MTVQSRRVLVVEDEMMIALMIQDMLEELGLEVVGPAARLDSALKLADAGALAAALLDVNLAGDRVYPVADRLRQLEVPFVFLTGYGNSGLDPSYKDCPVLAKPFQAADLKNALAVIMPPEHSAR